MINGLLYFLIDSNKPPDSLTDSWFGRCALNWQLTRSRGHGAFAPATVVRTGWFGYYQNQESIFLSMTFI